MENLQSIQDYLIFGLLLLVILLLNSLFIRGIHLITQGKTAVMPDGSSVNKGKIAYPIRKFFEKSEFFPMYYENTPLASLMDRFKEQFPHISFKEESHLGFVTDEAQKINFEVNQKAIEKFLGCNIEMIQRTNIGGSWDIRFFSLVEKFKYPEALRDLLYNCPPCMSTTWGTIFYWVNMLYVVGLEFDPKLVVIWLGYWLALAYLNFILEKK